MNSYLNLVATVRLLNRPTPYVGQKIIRKNYQTIAVRPFTEGTVQHVSRKHLSVLWQTGIAELYTLRNKDKYLEFID